MERKKGRRQGIAVALLIVGLSVFLVCIIPAGIALTLFYPIDTAGCYSDPTSYTVVEGKITQIRDAGGQLFLGIQTDPPRREIFADFYLCEKNAALVQADSFEEEVAEGDTVTVLAALEIFYDGGNFPVIALSAGGKEYLSQETGLQNQAAYSESEYAYTLEMFQKVFLPIAAAQIIGAGLAVVGTVLLLKRNEVKRAAETI